MAAVSHSKLTMPCRRTMCCACTTERFGEPGQQSTGTVANNHQITFAHRSPLQILPKSDRLLEQDLLAEYCIIDRRLVFIPDPLAPALGKQVIPYLRFYFHRSAINRHFQFVSPWLPSRQAGIPQVDNKRTPHDGTLNRVILFIKHATLLVEQSHVYR